METRKTEMAQFAPFINELTQKGCGDDVLKLAKEDLELGYPQELVAMYIQQGRNQFRQADKAENLVFALAPPVPQAVH